MAKEININFGLQKDFLWEICAVAKNFITWAQDRDEARAERQRQREAAQQQNQNSGEPQ